MTIKLTPDILRHAYDYLNATEPFRFWNLPDAEDVSFKVCRDKSVYGWHVLKNGRHHIAISESCVGHTVNLMAAMAHEMIHAHQNNSGLPLTHGKAFEKLAAKIAKVHGFDPRSL